MLTRRSFLQTAAAGAATAGWLLNYRALAATMKGKTKIRDVRTMVVDGGRTTGRNYTYVRIDTDQGPWGFGEAYGTPGIGIKEQVHALKPMLVGQDPLEIETILVKLDRHNDGSAHSFYRAISGIDMALFDLAGKILNVPVSTLLGGRKRDKVRVYDHAAPRNMWDKASCKEWAARCKENKSGFTCHKFSLRHTDAKEDPGRDLANRLLSSKELRLVRQGFENCREAIGDEHDIMVHCHWEYDLRTSIDLAKAVAPIKPVWLEDPLPVAYSESWKRLAEMCEVPLCTGENWMRRAEAQPFIVNSACDILHPDLRNSGGFLETRKMADLADLYFLPMATHNTGSVINTLGTCHWASTIRDFLACETIVGKNDWMDDVVLHEGPVIQGGFVAIPDKPGLGLELNPDTVKAHLGAGEQWWGA